MQRRAFLLAAAAVAACKGASGSKASPSAEPTATPPKRDPRVRPDEPEIGDKELVMTAPSGRDVDLTGTLEARSYSVAAGCTSGSNLERWLLLDAGGKRWLLNVMSPPDYAAMRDDDEENVAVAKRHAEERAADAGVTPFVTVPRRFARHVATPDDASKLGVRVGQRVRVRGRAEPLVYSGTFTIEAIFGVTTDKLEPA